MYRQYLGPILPNNPQVLEQDPSLPHCVICDIDGTVALMNGRGPYDRNKYLTDLPNTPVVNLVKELISGGTEVIYVSGRDERGREDTLQWLRNNGLWNTLYSRLFMRPAFDSREDSIIKEEIFNREFRGKYYVRFVLDDRRRVIDKWRELGLTALAVAEGEF